MWGETTITRTLTFQMNLRLHKNHNPGSTQIQSERSQEGNGISRDVATTWECFTRTLRDTFIRFVVQPSDIDPIIIVGLLFLCDNRFIVWNFDNNEQNITTIFTKNTSQSARYSNDRDDPIMARINNSPLGIDHSSKGFQSLLDPMDVGCSKHLSVKEQQQPIQFHQESVTYNYECRFSLHVLNRQHCIPPYGSFGQSICNNFVVISVRRSQSKQYVMLIVKCVSSW